MRKPKYRVLHVFGTLNCGGAESRIMDLYRCIDRELVQFDFLVLFSGNHYFNDEIRSLGGRIFVVRHPRNSLGGHIKDVYNVMTRKGPFQAVHCHTSYHSGLVLLVAMLAGIENRIAHARTTSSKNIQSISQKIILALGRLLLLCTTTRQVAISKSAGEFLFGKKAVAKNVVSVIPNAINLDLYKKMNKEEICLIEKALGDLDHQIVIGHVGRFSFMKNHRFIVDVAQRMKDRNIKFLVILVGDGELREEIEQMVFNRSLENQIMFLGIRSDIPALMKIFDVLVMPSLFEGLGGVVLEAQAAGTPCVVSDSLPEEVDMGVGLVDYLSLNESKDIWINMLLGAKEKEKPDSQAIYDAFVTRGYTLENSMAQLMNLYRINSD